MSRLGSLWTRVTGDGPEIRDRRAFLPAALEVLETPPSPAGRAMALAIPAFLVTALLWSLFGKIDIITTAQGRIVPVGKTKVIQSLEAGLVKAVHVQDGEAVRAGQVLIELDPTQPGADRDRLARDLAAADLDVARLTALKITAETGAPPSPMLTPPNASADDVTRARAALRAQVETRSAKIQALDAQISQKRAEVGEVAASLTKLSASLPMLAEKERLHRDLHDQGYGTTFSLLDAQQALSDARNDWNVLAERRRQAEAARADLVSQRAATVAGSAADILSDLSKAEEKRNALAQDFVKASDKSKNTLMVSPVDGVVEQLAVHTIGGVVTPAETLAIVVPRGGGLIVDARLANRDVGFVHPGQIASVKVDTFDFTQFGFIPGRVLAVSGDSLSAVESSRQFSDSADSAHADAVGAYVARIALDRGDIRIGGRRQSLIPGMSVTAEIKTGRRTVLNFLLSPLAKAASGALHER